MEQMQDKFSKYETARILGARALQIAMNAPLLIKLSKEDLEKVKYDSLKIAEIELDSNVLPGAESTQVYKTVLNLQVS